MRAHLRFFRHIAAHFTMTPPPFDHSKLVTVDGEWCVLGSSNWDTRSLRLNFEFDLECCGADFTKAIDALIDAKIARGKKSNGRRHAGPPDIATPARRGGPAPMRVSLKPAVPEITSPAFCRATSRIRHSAAERSTGPFAYPPHPSPFCAKT